MSDHTALRVLQASVVGTSDAAPDTERAGSGEKCVVVHEAPRGPAHMDRSGIAMVLQDSTHPPGRHRRPDAWVDDTDT